VALPSSAMGARHPPVRIQGYAMQVDRPDCKVAVGRRGVLLPSLYVLPPTTANGGCPTRCG
jgi:hypothetical protein